MEYVITNVIQYSTQYKVHPLFLFTILNHLEKLSPNRRADEQSTTISIFLTFAIHANNRVNNLKQHVQHQLSWRSKEDWFANPNAIIKCSSLTFAGCCGWNLDVTIKLQHMWIYTCAEHLGRGEPKMLFCRCCCENEIKLKTQDWRLKIGRLTTEDWRQCTGRRGPRDAHSYLSAKLPPDTFANKS